MANVFQKASGILLVGLLASPLQAQTPDIPDNVSGTYTLTYAFSSSGTPYPEGTVKTFVLNGATDTICVDGVSLGTGYTRAGGTEWLWNAGGGIIYALSLLDAGGFSEINVYSPTDNDWKGQFPSPGTFSSAVDCGGSGGNEPEPELSITIEAQNVFDLAAELYPDLFTGGSELQELQGYIYRVFTSGIYVGIKDDSVYLTGGPFGSTIQDKGTIAAVLASLQTLKTSVTVQPTADMTMLFDLAADVYPGLFAGGSAFQTSADGYLYRYFEGSGVYAAIKNGTVYVKGGSFGNVYTSVGALNALLTQLETLSMALPEGDFTLTVTGTVSVLGVSTPFSFTLQDTPAPSVSDQDAIEDAFLSALASAQGVTIVNFDYDVIENSADHVEFSVAVTATITQSGFPVTSNYVLNFDYTK